MNRTFSVSVASLSDAPQIVRLIAKFAENNLLLKRSLEEVRSQINDFIVVKNVTDDNFLTSHSHKPHSHSPPDSVVMGCVSVYKYSTTLAEIRSLCVEEAYQGMGLARRLLEEAIFLGKQLKLQELLSFTVEAEQFFIKLGFTQVVTHRLPAKVMKDCQKCACYGNCSAKCYSLKL